MTLSIKATVAAVLLLAAISITAPSASASLHEGPFHATQEYGMFFTGGFFDLSCEAHFEGEVTDGALDPTAEGFITSIEFTNCERACSNISVNTPVHVEFSGDGHIVLEDFHMAWPCLSTAFDAPTVEGTWDCAEHILIENQPFRLEGTTMIAMVWYAEWHVTGLENETCF